MAHPAEPDPEDAARPPRHAARRRAHARRRRAPPERRPLLKTTRLLALLLLAAGCATPTGEPTPPVPGGPPTILVLLRSAANAPSVRVETAGAYRIEPLGRVAPRTGAALREDFPLSRGGPQCRVRPQDGVVRVNGKPYPGSLRLVLAEGALVPVLETDLESYVTGVLAGELGSKFAPAALRAQAVASRTFALFRIRATPAGRPWHLADDTSAQVFVGIPPEPVFRAASADTKGQVLRWHGAVFSTYFHSTCGGHTASSAEALGDSTIPPLSGVPCDFCRAAKYYRWEARIPAAEVARAAGAAGEISDLSIARRGAGGRAVSFMAMADRPLTVGAADLRTRLGTGKLRSTLILSITRDGPDFVFAGGGWGHGVGMCQMGATAMGRSGASSADILSHYYPGSELFRMY